MKERDYHSRASAHVVLALYGLFAALWGLGLILGLREGIGHVVVGGLPVWFVISCIAAYVIIALALTWAVRRYF